MLPHRPRHQSSLSGVVVALFVAALLLTPAPAEAGNGLDLVSHLPDSFNLVVGVDMGQARKSPLFKTWQKGLKEDVQRANGYAEFVRRLGFDPAVDVESVVVGAQVAQDTKTPMFLTVAKGNFDPKKAYKALLQGPKEGKGGGKKSAASKPKTKKYQGVKYLVATDSGRPIAAAITKGTALVGAEEAVKLGIDLMKGKGGKGGKSVADNSRLMKLAKRATTGGAAWVAVVLPDTLQPNPKMGPAGALATARDIFGTVHLSDGLDLVITSICPDEGIAAGLQQALMIGVASAQRNPIVAQTGAGKVLAKLKTDVKGKELITSLKLGDKEFQAMIDQVAAQVDPSRRGAAPANNRAPPRKTK